MSGDPRRPSRRAIRRTVRVATIIAVLAVGAGIAFAWSVTTSNPGNSVTGRVLAAPTGLAIARIPTTGNTCTSTTISWNAVPGANRYRVEGRTANAAWATLAASHTTTSYTHATSMTHRTFRARVTPFVQGSSWEGPSVDTTITCGVGEVSDVAVTNPCSRSAISWSAATGATNYDVVRRINGGAATTIATDQAGTTYSDTSGLGIGDLVEYWVVPGTGATDGQSSNTSTVASWDNFRVTSVVLENGGTASTHDSGDRVVVQFSKPAHASSATSTTVWVQRNGNPKGLFLGSDAATLAATQVGQVDTPNGLIGNANANRTLAGATAWSNGGLTWTWTSTDPTAGPPMTADLSGTWAVGTNAALARCATDDATTISATPAPTLGGRW